MGRHPGHLHRRHLVGEVEEGGRLVEQEHPRLLGQRAGEEDPPPLAAGEGVDPPVGEVGEVAGGQRPLHRAQVVAAGDGQQPLVRRPAHHDRLAHREGPVEPRLLGDEGADPGHLAARRGGRVEAAQPDRAGLRREQPGHQADERRLAGAVGAEQADELALAGREGDAVHRGARAVAEADLAQVDDRIGPGGHRARGLAAASGRAAARGSRHASGLAAGGPAEQPQEEGPAHEGGHRADRRLGAEAAGRRGAPRRRPAPGRRRRSSAETGRSRRWSGPTSRRATCGTMSPTKPTSPASATAAPVAAEAAKKTWARARGTSTPSEAASSSPSRRRLRRAERSRSAPVDSSHHHRARQPASRPPRSRWRR